jgi:hypothetical protein
VPRKVFVAGEILTAADVNTNLMDQAVMSFAGTAARGSAIPSPVEGMATYLAAAPKGVEVYNGTAWKRVANVSGSVLQVVSTIKTDGFSSSSTTPTDITGLSVTITPISSTSKILCFWNVTGGVSAPSGQAPTAVQLVRDSTVIGGGTPAGSRVSATSSNAIDNVNKQAIHAGSFLDSPSTTSATVYKLRMFIGAGTFFVNRSGNDSDSADPGHARTASTITVMEISA